MENNNPSRVTEAREWIARGKRVFRPDIVSDLCDEIEAQRDVDAKKCDEIAAKYPGIRSGVAEMCAAAIRVNRTANADEVEKALVDSQFSEDEQLIATAILEARRIQEFLWGELSFRNYPYLDRDWQSAFKKRVDRLASINYEHPNALVEIRKRLLQQAALSIAAMVTISKHGLGSL